MGKIGRRRNLRRLGMALRLIGLMGSMGSMGSMGLIRRGYHSPIFPHLPYVPYSPYSPYIPYLPYRPYAPTRHNQREIISCQKGAECYTRQKCHRWVVLDVRPIGGIFSRGRNRPLITTNYPMVCMRTEALIKAMARMRLISTSLSAWCWFWLTSLM